jgi:hypothetical protein
MTWQLDATALSALLDVREITPLQLLDQALARLDALEPMLNAFTYVDRDGAFSGKRNSPSRSARSLGRRSFGFAPAIASSPAPANKAVLEVCPTRCWREVDSNFP